MIVCIVAGVLVFLLSAFLCIACILRRKRQQCTENNQRSEHYGTVDNFMYQDRSAGMGIGIVPDVLYDSVSANGHHQVGVHSSHQVKNADDCKVKGGGNDVYAQVRKNNGHAETNQ